MKYTKGEWEVKTQKAARYWKAEVRTPPIREDNHYTSTGQLIAVCYGNNTVANAHLIVTAVNACISVNPDNPMAVAESIKNMYEALKSLVIWLGSDTNFEQAQRAKEALAKAEVKVTT